MVDLNWENFKAEVLKSRGLFLVDFWSPVCSPCQKMSLILDNVSQEVKEVKFGKVNILEEPEIARNYKIPATPTIIIFKDGEVIERAAGLRSEQVIINKLNSLMGL
ncbi:thiol reductase thioredoxin [Candidatus Woesearchaeota archaeon]|nr:thiol reductase thioredoxin [Candidatus Woesearchaeota archaeon]